MIRYLLVAALLCVGCKRGPEGTEDGDCSDSKDNDFDGTYDCDDDGCLASNYCVEQTRAALATQNAKKLEREAAAKASNKETAPKEPQEDNSPFFTIDDLLVQKGNNNEDINWKHASEYCDKLNLEGNRGWRLPTQDEALKIVKSGKLVNEPSYVMWTSTKQGKSRAIIVGITSGAANHIGVNSTGECRARCIKSI